MTQEFEATLARTVAKDQSLKQVFGTTRAALEPKFGDWVNIDHCVPFDVSRASDEARGVVDPQIWTEQKDLEMWSAL